MSTESDTVLLAEFKSLSSSAEIDLSIYVIALLLASLLIEDAVGLQFIFRCDRAVVLLQEVCTAAKLMRAYRSTDLEVVSESTLQAVT